MNQVITLLPMLVIVGVFMFFASRRQKRAMQATIDLHESLAGSAELAAGIAIATAAIGIAATAAIGARR
jgi:preprotein translocase YajC subunit